MMPTRQSRLSFGLHCVDRLASAIAVEPESPIRSAQRFSPLLSIREACAAVHRIQPLMAPRIRKVVCLLGTSLLLAAAPQLATAGSGIVEGYARTVFQHCCAAYGITPDLQSGWRSLGSSGFSYEGFGSEGTRLQILLGGSAAAGRVMGFDHVDGQARGYHLAYVETGVEASWRDTVTAPSGSAPDGTPVPVRIVRLAQQLGDLDANAKVNILGWDVNMWEQPSGFFYHEEVVNDFITVGKAVNVGMKLRSEVGIPRLPQAFMSSESFVMAAYSIEVLDPRFALNDDEGNPVRNPRVTQGLNDQRPMSPASEQRTDDGGSVYTFPLDVIGGDGQTPRVYVDPVVASGYEFNVLSGPLFTTVLLPNTGDGLYRVEVWNGSGWEDVGVEVRAGESFDFRSRTGATGISRFRVNGIEESAGIDPHGHQFVTGLTFNASGEVLMTQRSLVTSVPEPGTWALLAGGLLVIACRRRARLS